MGAGHYDLAFQSRSRACASTSPNAAFTTGTKGRGTAGTLKTAEGSTPRTAGKSWFPSGTTSKTGALRVRYT